MSITSINNNTSTEVKSTSLENPSMLNNRKVVQIASGVSTAALIGGSIALGILGGPIGAIIGLAVAAFIALAMFIRSVVSQPNVTSVETKTEEKTTVVETAKVEEIATTIPAPKAVRFQRIRDAFASNVTFAGEKARNVLTSGRNVLASGVNFAGQKARNALTSGRNGLASGVNFVKQHPKASIGVASVAGLAASAYGFSVVAPDLTQNILNAASQNTVAAMQMLNESTKPARDFVAAKTAAGIELLNNGTEQVKQTLAPYINNARNYVEPTLVNLSNKAYNVTQTAKQAILNQFPLNMGVPA